MFGAYWSNARGDVTNLICHVTSQAHMIEGYDFMGGGASFYVIALLSLVAMGIVVVKTYFNLPQDHMIKESCGFMGGSLLWESTPCQVWWQ